MAARTSIHELPSDRAHDQCALPFAFAAWDGLGPWPRRARDLLALRPSEPPGGDDERGGDRDRDERDGGHPRLARPAVTALHGDATCAQRASSSPTVKRELYSSTNGWPSRPSDSAYERRKPRTYVGAGRMSKRSSSRARRYFGRIFVRSSSSGKSRF